jgi:hypothetical protein
VNFLELTGPLYMGDSKSNLTRINARQVGRGVERVENRVV